MSARGDTLICGGFAPSPMTGAAAAGYIQGADREIKNLLGGEKLLPTR